MGPMPVGLMPVGQRHRPAECTATTMADLAGAGTRVLLVATANHDAGSTLPGLPPVLGTLEDLAEALTDRCGVVNC